MHIDNLKEGNWMAFQNTKKRDADPDYIGEANIEGVKTPIIIWHDNDSEGNSSLYGSINSIWEFVAFHNTKKRDTHPNYRGIIIIDEVQKEIVVWIKRDKNDDQFLSGSVNPLKVGDIQTGDHE